MQKCLQIWVNFVKFSINYNNGKRILCGSVCVPPNTFQDPEPSFLEPSPLLANPPFCQMVHPLKIVPQDILLWLMKIFYFDLTDLLQIVSLERIHKMSIHERYSFFSSKKLLIPPFLNHHPFSCFIQGRQHKFQSGEGGGQITTFSRSVYSFRKH